MNQLDVHDDDGATGFTRRTVLAGAAATAAATVASSASVNAQSVETNSKPDLIVFVLLSAALTGIAEPKLAPGFNRVPPLPLPVTSGPTTPPPPIDLQKSDPGSDPVDIKQEYFVWINDRCPAAFENLLRMMKNCLTTSDPAQAIISQLQFKDDDKRTRSEVEAKYLARSIVLMWYLGAWYDPDDLEAASGNSNPDPGPIFRVISPKAYTQSWALRVAQAHPMGFSQMQFGYWHRQPNKLSDYIGKDIA
jgi:hypothetical protein